MRSFNLIAACAILLAGRTYAQNPPTILTLNAGETLYAAALTFNAEVTKCYLEDPSGSVVEFKPNDESEDRFELLPDSIASGCHANVHDVQAIDTGIWTITAKLENESRTQSYNLTVDSPKVEETVPELLDEKNIHTRLGETETVYIRDYSFVKSESCHVIAPSGVKYDLVGLNLENVEVIPHDDGACALSIHVVSEDVVGNWTLISKGTRYSENIERRLPFTINVEEIVNASVSEVIVVEGNDFYARLKNSIDNYDTCRLMGPDGKEFNNYELDSRYLQNCGYIVRNIQKSDGGQWEIVYGNNIIYRAPIQVIINAASTGAASTVEWTKDQPLEAILGDEDAVHCRVESPEGLVYYDGFGRCQLEINRVTMAHDGIWKLSVGLSGRVLTEDTAFLVKVVEAEPKAVVTTNVVANKPTVSLTCTVSSPSPIRSCKFRDPSGRVLLASEGVGESRYSFHGAGVSYSSNVHTHDCGLLITDPIVQDLGLWRCAIETEGDVYYGFLSVLCPWALRDPEVAAAVITEPTLTANRDTVSNVVGESVSMACSVQSAIRYCYFRARNGTIFNVGPADSHDQATYVGAGFDAGECGIQFTSLAVSDSGAWSCHVGLVDNQAAEQRAGIDVTIHDSMVADQRVVGSHLVVEAQVYDQRTLEYCRFVRIDGLGFTTTTMPAEYSNLSVLSQGKCGIAINNPSVLEHHPWTVVARIRGQNVELSRQTPITLQGPSPPQEEVIIYYRLPIAWIVVLVVGVTLIMLGALLGPKNNRKWTYSRASSIRNSFIRKSVDQQNHPEKNAPMAA